MVQITSKRHREIQFRSSLTTMDFDESSNKLVTQEFLAVVLAGFGNEYVAHIDPYFPVLMVFFSIRLTPLTSNHGDEPCPKALLPIANKPMLDYPLAWLESSGIRGAYYELCLPGSYDRSQSLR